MDDRWNVWVWEQRFWLIAGVFNAREEALAVAGQINSLCTLSAAVIHIGSKQNEYIRTHRQERHAPWTTGGE